MRFDVVIGNPPYNDDIYLDFGLLGFQISSKFTCMITPAKWQAKTGGNNKLFRDTITAYISNIIYFPDATDLFDVAESDGVAVYLADKQEHKEKSIENRCIKQSLFNNTEIRSLEFTINNTLNKIVSKVKRLNTPVIQVNTDRNYWLKPNTSLLEDIADSRDDYVRVFGGNTSGEKLLYGYCRLSSIEKSINDIDKYKAVMHFKQGTGYFTVDSDGKTPGLKPINIYLPGEICKDDYLCLLTSESLETVLSYKSYIQTKFIRFLIFSGCVGDNASNQETWRFVPDQEVFDHMFTDLELYDKYKLTQEEIKIIESIIKS